MKQPQHFGFPYKIIFLTGVDGSGKTCLAGKLRELLKSRNVPSVHRWSRFNNYLSKPLLGFTRAIGLNYYEEVNRGRIGYHDFEKSPAISTLFIMLQLIDGWAANLARFWLPALIKRTVIIADRGPFDTLIDLMVDTKKTELGKSKRAKLLFMFIPKPYAILHIRRSLDNILRDRPDVKADRHFYLKQTLYLEYCDFFNIPYTDNNGSPENTFKQLILKLNLSKYAEEN